MTYLYQALEAHENAKTLLTLDLDESVIAHGSPFVKESLLLFVRWLQDLKGMSQSEEVFQKQFIEPVKLTSEYVLKIAKKTETIRGWVFAKSRKYKDAYTGNYKKTISMVVPELLTVMSLRCSEEEADKISYGLNKFSFVKPLPLTNRLLQFKPKHEKISEVQEIGEWDFLKANLEDLVNFQCSVEMEHYCEIPSKDSEKRHLLGCPLVISGKVVAADWPYLSIQSSTNQNVETEFSISEHLDKSIQPFRIEDFVGKHVRLFCVCWYDSGLESNSHPKHPEAFFIQECKSEDESKLHDVTGYVRIRKNLSINTLKQKFPDIDVSKIIHLKFENGTVSLESVQQAENDIVKSYIETSEKISSLRNSGKSEDQLFLMPEDVLDAEKVSIKYLSKKDDDVGILLRIIRFTDWNWKIPLSKLPVEEKNLRGSKTRWFLDSGLIEKKDNGIILSQKGFEVAYSSQENFIKNHLDGIKDQIILISELENLFPPSILVRFLEENNFKKYSIYGFESELFWHKSEVFQAPEIKKKIGYLFDALCKPAMKKMSEARHQFHYSAILDRLMSMDYEGRINSSSKENLSYFCAKRIIEQMIKTGLISQQGNYLEMSLPTRIYYLLKSNPGRIFSIKEIVNQIIFPAGDSGQSVWGKTDEMKMTLAKKTLNDLQKNNKVTQFQKDCWTSYLNPEEFKSKLNQFIKLQIRSSVKTILKGKTIDETKFKGLIDFRVRKICGDGYSRLNAKALQEETIREMIAKNEIIVYDGMIKLSGPKNGEPISGKLMV